jgi:hypothetical protein
VIAVGGGESSNGGWCCPEALLRLCKSEGEGEVRHTGFETGVTGEGSSPRCGHGGGSNFHGGSGSCDGRTAWRGLVGKCREGGTRRVKKACDGVKREEGVAQRPFSGRRHTREERDGGVVDAWPRGGGGGPGHGARSSWGPRTRATCGRAAAARGRRRWVTRWGGRGIERRERERGADEWAGAGGGAQLQREKKMGGRKRGRWVGPARGGTRRQGEE